MENNYKDIDPYGEEIWENEFLYGIAYLNSIRGLYPDIDNITDRICRDMNRLQSWYAMPWYKKILINKYSYLLKN